MDVYEEAINRMQKILEHFSRKFKIAMCLSVFFKKSCFKNLFKPHNIQTYKKLYKLCVMSMSYEDHKSIEQNSNNGSMGIISSQSNYLRNELQWAVILENLDQYEKQILSMMNDNLDEIPPNYVDLINYIDLLKQIVLWQMRITPKQMRERKVILRNADVLITRTQGEIEQFTNDFENETQKYTDMAKISQDEINQLNSIIGEIKRKHCKELDREINSYKIAMRRLSDDIVEEENGLDNQLEAHEAMLDKLMLANLEREKQLKDYCKISEKKYIMTRNAYDRDLRKLHELKETLEMHLYIMSNHYEMLKKEYNEQSILFTNLKEEREFAIMQEFAERLENFEKNRAARIIQRTWRAYHARILSKKKKRTRKNK